MKYFTKCRTIEDVKETFRDLAKKLHPDCGGDAEEFKRMMAEYTVIFKRLKNVHRKADQKTEQTENNRTEYHKEESPEEFADIISKVIHLDGIEIEIVGHWVWLSGNTYPRTAKRSRRPAFSSLLNIKSGIGTAAQRRAKSTASSRLNRSKIFTVREP